ncbi:MAG: hypothetical protein PVF55_01540 [Desulfobacterales bacterium]
MLIVLSHHNLKVLVEFESFPIIRKAPICKSLNHKYRLTYWIYNYTDSFMIRFYSSRDLSRKLRIPLNRWKRWAREFLPPDPLGGLQSGYARQFSTREAFSVYLGGFLVAGLGFSIPQARQIIRDLSGWMKKSGLDAALMGRGSDGHDNGHDSRRYEVQILGRSVAAGSGHGKLAYRIRAIDPPRMVTGARSNQWVETYTETTLKSPPASTDGSYPPLRCLLDISALTDRFIRLMTSP